MAKNMRPGPKWLPAVIIKRLGPLTYLVDVNGNSWKCHIDHLRIQTDAPSENLTLEGDDLYVSPTISSPELPFSESNIPSREVEPPKTADNSAAELTISIKSQDASMPEPVQVGYYPTRAQKAPERYQPAPN